jgi:AraC-like DNA-binding protein
MKSEIIRKHEDDLERIQVEVDDYIRIELQGLMKAPPGWKGKKHAHPFRELVYICSGSGELFFKKIQTTWSIGDLFLLPPYEDHQFINTGKSETEHLYLGFSFAMDPPFKQTKDIQLPLLQTPETELIASELNEISGIFREKNPGQVLNACRPQVLGIILKVLKMIMPEQEQVKDITESRNRIIANKAREYLETNLHRNISVRDVAQNFYLSPHYFGEIFKQVTGTNIKACHNMMKMNRAIDLLKNSSLQITEIAGKLGFDNIHYFSRKFKEFYKVSPAEYRKKN